MSSNQFRVGVLMTGSVQLLDVSPVDLFGMLHADYLRACRLPKPITDLGVDVQVLYISKASPFNECTANAALRVTHSIGSLECAPGMLDVLFIPGPEPSAVPDEDIKEFVRAHAKALGTTVMTVCTGVYVAGHSGILDGKLATGPRALVPELRKKFPNAKWVEKRWEVDGNIWNSGGITNGQDMVAAYLKQRWPGSLSDCVCALADVGPRGQEYGNSSLSENAWWISRIFNAWVFGK